MILPFNTFCHTVGIISVYLFRILILILRQGCEVSVKELNSLLSLLMDKKRKMEQEEAETNLQILLEFLRCLKKQKVDELNEVFH